MPTLQIKCLTGPDAGKTEEVAAEQVDAILCGLGQIAASLLQCGDLLLSIPDSTLPVDNALIAARDAFRRQSEDIDGLVDTLASWG